MLRTTGSMSYSKTQPARLLRQLRAQLLHRHQQQRETPTANSYGDRNSHSYVNCYSPAYCHGDSNSHCYAYADATATATTTATATATYTNGYSG